MTVAALFVRSDSVYRDLGADCWDEARDARRYSGSYPVVAHPPCRAWGRLRTFAKPRVDEIDLARFAIATVRRCGGVLEHPSASMLWREFELVAGRPDAFGGSLIHVSQSWFGHRAPKLTGLYVCGLPLSALPEIPFHLGIAPGRVENMGKREREATPPALAAWLLSVARASA